MIGALAARVIRYISCQSMMGITSRIVGKQEGGGSQAMRRDCSIISRSEAMSRFVSGSTESDFSIFRQP